MKIFIQEYVDLLPYNSFHFSCIARYFVEINSPEELGALIIHPIYLTTAKKLILGGGSNILFAEDTFAGLVIQVSILGKTILQKTNKEILVEVGAGENRTDFVRRTIDQGRIGAENLVSIPGTVGATPVQNIGAYGTEAKDIIVGVSGIHTKTGEKKFFSNDACAFGYRTSVFKTQLKDDFIISSVQFRLAKYNEEEYIGNVNYEGVASRTEVVQQKEPKKNKVWCIATAIAEIRASKLPDLTKIGTAGSFFQNPLIPVDQFHQLLVNFPQLKGRPTTLQTAPSSHIKLSAGQLIELAGFKGYTHRNVGVYTHHALVLVHYGNGTGADLLELINLITHQVKTLFHIQLIPEVNIVR